MSNSTESMFDLGTEGVPDGMIEKVTSACEEAVDLMEAISSFEASATAAKSRLHHLRSKLIPEAMAEAGIGDVLSLDSGYMIEIKSFVSGSLPKDEEKKLAAIAALELIGGEALIKTMVNMSFGKGEKDDADALLVLLAADGYIADVVEGVHPQSLQAFAREKLKNGEEIPLETLGLFSGVVAKIKPPKVAK